MFKKEKMFIIAENVDDTIKSLATGYDITVFRTFTDFEAYVDKVPVVLDTIVLSARSLPFTSQNMSRMFNVLESPFMKLEGNVLYLIDKSTDLESVTKFLEDKDRRNWAVYRGDLSVKFITDIVTGAGRVADEGVNEVITYMVRASDYVKQQNQLKYESNEADYITDEMLLQGIPDEEEPEEVNPSQEEFMQVHYVVGLKCIERSLFSFVLAQYLSMNKKTLIMEKDIEYHTLGELMTKSGLEYEYVPVEELYKDTTYTLDKIRNSASRLIFVGTKNRYNYDYDFLMDLCISNLSDCIDSVVRECNFSEVPYGKAFTVVTPNTIPSVLNTCNQMEFEFDPSMVTFVGVQATDLGMVNISSKELKAIAEVTLGRNGIEAQVVKVSGVRLRGEEAVYDIFSVLNRGNTR